MWSSIKLDHSPTLYSQRLAQMTPGFSGADISNVVNEAAIRAASINKKLVSVNELDYALDRILAGNLLFSLFYIFTCRCRKEIAYFSWRRTWNCCLSRSWSCTCGLAAERNWRATKGWLFFLQGCTDILSLIGVIKMTLSQLLFEFKWFWLFLIFLNILLQANQEFINEVFLKYYSESKISY